jgi:MFS family permease
MPSESTAAIFEGEANLAAAGAYPVETPISRRFMLLWSGQGISIIGSQLSALTIQVIAVSTLGANAMQMGILTASQTIPYLVFSLFVGLMIDRVSKRRLLIISDIVRFATMLLAAVLLLLGTLTILELCGVVCFISVFNLVFDAALGALIPQMFTRSQRLTINSRLNITASGGDVVGPTLAGIALQVLRASGAMMVDAATYVVSSLCIWFSVPKTQAAFYEGRGETLQVPFARVSGVLEAIREGLVFVFSHPLLRAFAIGSAVWNFSWSAVLAVLVIQLTRTLHLGATQIGLVFAIGGVGGIVGASLGAWLGRHWQTRKVLSLAPAVGAIGGAILLIIHPGHPFAIAALALFLYGVGESCFGVNMQTCRQGVTPMRLMGRMDTTMRFCFKGMASLGAVSGGFIGSRWGVHDAIGFGVAGLFIAASGLAIFFLGETSASVSP